MDAKLKHLEFIQGVINRMASNSFLLKGWNVVLVSALLVLITREGGSDLALIALAPVIMFWGLDAYFLWQERLHRALYDHVRLLDPHDIDFAMKTGVSVSTKLTWWAALFSRTILVFYIAVAIAVIVAILI